MFASLSPFAAEIMLGLDPNILLVAGTWAVLTAVIVMFRIGKPEGYLAHCILHLATPENFRPGRVRMSDYEYPIADIYELRKSPEEIIKSLTYDGYDL